MPLNKDLTAKIPKALMKRLGKVWDLAFKVFGDSGSQKGNFVSEFMGEVATGLILNTVGFETADEHSRFTWAHSNNGPDQIAQEKGSGVWGIFEAKGGSGVLNAKTDNGSQMSGKWMDHWIKTLYESNSGPASDDLRQAFQGNDDMVASVTRLSIKKSEAAGSTITTEGGSAVKVTFAVTMQVYKMNTPGSLALWAQEWRASGWRL